MTTPETGLKIPGRVAAPDDVTALADEVFTRGRKFGQSYRDMIAEAIMTDRAARLASLEALLHDIASDCRPPTAHAGNALRQIGDKIERAMEGVSAGVASLEAERAKTVEECAAICDARIADQSRRQTAFYAGGQDRFGELSHARHCEAFEIGQAIRALASEKGQADG